MGLGRGKKDVFNALMSNLGPLIYYSKIINSSLRSFDRYLKTRIRVRPTTAPCLESELPMAEGYPIDGTKGLAQLCWQHFSPFLLSA